MITEDKLFKSHPHATGRGLKKKEGKLAILSFPVDEGGCGWYRTRQNLQALEKYQDVSFYLMSKDDKNEELLQKAFKVADVILARHWGNLPLIQAAKTLNKKIVFDDDDRTDLIAPSNEHYVDNGMEDVTEIRNGQAIEVWKHGKTPGFDKYKNRKKWLDTIECFETADLVTATTERLADAWRVYNPNVEVIPNLIDFDLYKDHVKVTDTTKAGGRLHIGWSGGVSHFADFAEIAAPFSKIVNKHNVIHHSVGFFPEQAFPKIDMNKVRPLPWMPFKAHPMNLKLLDLDIGIIPLEVINADDPDLDFNTYKSPIKWQELAALRVPCVVKNMHPYKADIEDGVTGLLYDTPEEFRQQMERLIKDPELRKKIGDNAFDWVYENRNLEKWSEKLVDIYTKVANG